MLHACTTRFDVTKNLEKYFGFRWELNKALLLLSLTAVNEVLDPFYSYGQGCRSAECKARTMLCPSKTTAKLHVQFSEAATCELVQAAGKAKKGWIRVEWNNS